MQEQVKERLRTTAEKLLREGRVRGVLGLYRTGGHVGPFLFTRPEDLGALSLGDVDSPGHARYPLVKILTRLAQRYPADTLAVMVRGCDERAIDRLVRSSQLNSNRLILLGFPCPETLAAAHDCEKPYPDALTAGVKPETSSRTPVILPTPKTLINDFGLMKASSDRCLKCYGCRNICPVCFCRECTLAEDIFIPKGDLTPVNPDFLITRAVHMAGYCVYCGLCEEACPADIPLMAIYRIVADIIGEAGGPVFKSVPKRGDADGERHAV